MVPGAGGAGRLGITTRMRGVFPHANLTSGTMSAWSAYHISIKNKYEGWGFEDGGGTHDEITVFTEEWQH